MIPTRVPPFLGGLVMLLLILPLAFVGSAAAVEEPAGRPDEPWERQARDVEWMPSSNGFAYRSLRGDASDFDVVEGSYSTVLHTMRFSFLSRGANNASFTLNVTYVGLFEFRDVDASGGYSLGDDVVQRVRLRDIPPAVVAVDLDKTSTQTHVATVTYPLGSAVPPGPRDPALVFRFRAPVQYDTMDGVGIASSALRVDTEIHRFPFRQNDTQVALETALDSSLDIAAETDRAWGAEGVFVGALAWDEAAYADGEPRPMQVASWEVQSAPGGADQQLIFSLPRGDAVEHGSSMGVRRYQTESLPEFIGRMAGDWRLYAMGLSIAAVVLGLSVWRRIGH